MKQIDLFYADDDDDDLMFFKEAIDTISEDTESTIVLHIHKNGDDLTDNLRKNKNLHGLVFLDINMPLKNGFQLLDEIRHDNLIKHFPVVMYSTSSNQDNIDKAHSLGANFYVIKPYKYDNLLEMIFKFINMDWENHKVEIPTFLYK